MCSASAIFCWRVTAFPSRESLSLIRRLSNCTRLTTASSSTTRKRRSDKPDDSHDRQHTLTLLVGLEIASGSFSVLGSERTVQIRRVEQARGVDHGERVVPGVDGRDGLVRIFLLESTTIFHGILHGIDQDAIAKDQWTEVVHCWLLRLLEGNGVDLIDGETMRSKRSDNEGGGEGAGAYDVARISSRILENVHSWQVCREIAEIVETKYFESL